jgi:peroxiredoxin
MRIPLVLVLALGLAGTSPAAVSVGERLVPFTLKDTSGKDIDVASYQGKKALVLMFIATQCPVSNSYNTRMAEISKRYADKGVAFVGINSNKQESVAEVAEHAQKHGFSFPVLKDVGNVQADRFGAQVTPEIYAYDASLTLRYHGRIDDSREESGVHTRDLQNALDAILEGKPVPLAETKAFGCTIKRVQN